MSPQGASSAKPYRAAMVLTDDRKATTSHGMREVDKTVLRSEDVGFATVELRTLSDWPWLEVHIRADNVDIQQDSVQKLLGFVSEVLHSERAAAGFGLTYDFRLLKNPSVSALMAIARWAAEGERKDLFKQRCVSCKTCVPVGWKFAATKAAMSAFFMITPPTCRTYLTTDFDDLSAPMAVFEAPEDGTPRSRGSSAKLAAKDSGSVDSVKSFNSATTMDTEGGPSRRQSMTRTPVALPSCLSCLAGLPSLLGGGRRDTPELASCDDLRRALQRIEDLERSSKELQQTVHRQRERLDVLEAAVPWASAMAHLGLPGKIACAD